MTPPDDLRRTVLDASLDLIRQEGLGALSMREVARRAGVSHQAPYHHFGDREGILAALAHEGAERLHDAMKRAVVGIDDPVKRLQAVGEAYVGFALDNPSHFKLMFRSELVRHEHPVAKAEADTAFDLLVNLVDDVAVQRWGAKRPGLALTAWSLAHGLASLVLEGKIDRHCGGAPEARAHAVQMVLASFSDLLEQKPYAGV